MELDIKKMEKILGAEIPKEARKDLKTAWDFYRKFWKRNPRKMREVTLPIPRAMAEMGDLIAVVYVKGKRTPRAYIHVFKPPFPVLATGEGRLFILDGGFEVDEKGILH